MSDDRGPGPLSSDEIWKFNSKFIEFSPTIEVVRRSCTSGAQICLTHQSSLASYRAPYCLHNHTKLVLARLPAPARPYPYVRILSSIEFPRRVCISNAGGGALGGYRYGGWVLYYYPGKSYWVPAGIRLPARGYDNNTWVLPWVDRCSNKYYGWC